MLFLFLFFFSSLFSTPTLKNITQVTDSSMGFKQAGEGYFSPDGEKIIFQAVPEGKENFQIYIMDLKEKKPKMISTGIGSCTCAYFRPDGEKVIFASSHLNPNLEEEENQQQIKEGKYRWHFTPYMNIYEANLDGSELKPLTTGKSYHAECSYSLDGQKIVYASNEDGFMNLFIMDFDGKNPVQITYNSSCYYGGPFFSPDGQKIVFRADKEKADYLQIYTLCLKSFRQDQLTYNEHVNWSPYYHPTGKYIAYTTSIHGHHQYEIYLLDLTTFQETRLTFNPSFDGLPVFNPKGDKLLWTSKRGGKFSQLFIGDFIYQ